MKLITALAIAAALICTTTTTAAKGKAAKTEVTVDTAKVNLNTATAEDLATLPGVGEKKALNIIAGRPYATLTDVTENVKGIGAKTAAKWEGLICF